MDFLSNISKAKLEGLSVSMLFIVALAIVTFSRQSRLTNSQAITAESPVEIILQKETDLQKLGEILSDSGLIEDENIDEMVWAGSIYGWKKFLRGRYYVSGNHTYDSLLSKLSRGIQDPVSVTVPPGSDKSRIFELISSRMHFDSTDIAETFHDSSFTSQLGIETKDLIGRMLPDSYSFYWTSNSESVLKKIITTFQNKVADPYNERLIEIDRPLEDIVTLASIIEWEAHHEDEKAKISGLYWNRLNRGMRLQADPTVLFALGEKRRILFEDYKIDHPYNTYNHRGLPPGPITNPSLSSIKAALFPDDHDYLFMVASPDGYHVFTKSFEQHKKESAKWRKWIREQYRLKTENDGKDEDPSS